MSMSTKGEWYLFVFLNLQNRNLCWDDHLSDEVTESLSRLSTMPPLVAPPMHVDSAYMDLTSLREASDLSLLRSTTLLSSDAPAVEGSCCSCCCSCCCSVSGAAAAAWIVTVASLLASSDSLSSATLESGGGESQIEEDDDDAESASPELTPDELGVLKSNIKVNGITDSKMQNI